MPSLPPMPTCWHSKPWRGGAALRWPPPSCTSPRRPSATRLHASKSHLGVKLFERSAHGVRLSPAGEHYLSRVAGALSAITTATDDMRQGVSNSLYVHCSPSLATPVADAAAACVCGGPSGNRSELVGRAHAQRLRARSSRTSISAMACRSWPDLVVEPLFEERIVPLASPAFIRATVSSAPTNCCGAADPEQRERRAVVGLVRRVYGQTCAGALRAALRPGAHVTRRRHARTRRGSGKHDDWRQHLAEGKLRPVLGSTNPSA